VAARFTLDAMPGKQMAIDADLNAGLIDEHEARRRREEIAREADFYGAMDGSSKFVRGDAIAAVVMIVVNILGGFIIGMAQRGMDLPTALRTYTLLTVGEGLVTQIPALVMATATGLIVTRSSSGAPLGKDLTAQLLSSPRAVGLVAGTLGALALVPGLPKLPFLLVAAGVAGLATTLQRPRPAHPAQAPPTRPAAPAAEQLVELISVEPIELEIGLDLISLADPAQGGNLLERISTLRRRIAEEMGLMVPPLRVRDNLTLRALSYAIKLSSVRVAQGEVRPGYMLAMTATGGRPDLPGIEATDPAFGLPARWISENRRVDAEMMGCTVVDAGTVLLTHLEEVVKRHAADLLSLQDVRTMLDHLRQQAPALVEELVPKTITISELHRVLASLLKERVPIRDLPRILTTLAAHASAIREAESLTELARQALARTITAQHTEDDGTLWVCGLDPAAEAQLLARARGQDDGLDPDWTDKLVRGLKRGMERLLARGHAPVLLCSPSVRPLVRALIERRAPTLTVLSHAEIAPEAKVRSVGLAGVDSEAIPITEEDEL
jgi:flagellar biosynthesis protein FlhA